VFFKAFFAYLITYICATLLLLITYVIPAFRYVASEFFSPFYAVLSNMAAHPIVFPIVIVYIYASALFLAVLMRTGSNQVDLGLMFAMLSFLGMLFAATLYFSQLYGGPPIYYGGYSEQILMLVIVGMIFYRIAFMIIVRQIVQIFDLDDVAGVGLLLFCYGMIIHFYTPLHILSSLIFVLTYVYLAHDFEKQGKRVLKYLADSQALIAISLYFLGFYTLEIPALGPIIILLMPKIHTILGASIILLRIKKLKLLQG